jgi:hypothetical protein
MSKLRVIGVLVAMAMPVAVGACSSSDKPDASPASTTTSAPPRADAARRVIVEGAAMLDRKPVTSRWVGAVVLDDGLVTPCQTALPPVANGRYSVSVFTDAASAGCGKAGGEVALWIFANDKIHYSTNTMPWPADENSRATFDATYDASNPEGAVPEVAQFQGGAFAADGSPLPAGTLVEAFVGDARCGVASVRVSRDFRGYVMSVVGPDAIAGCMRDTPIAFRLDGKPATRAKVMNTPPGLDETLNLTVG